MVRLMRALVGLCAAALLGCGGGGGDDASGAAQRGGTFRATFDEPVYEVSGVEGTPPTFWAEVALAVTGEAATEGVYLFATVDDAILLDVEGHFSTGGMLNLGITLRGDLAPGDYSGEIVLRACLDEACTRLPQGGPARVPIQYRVLPNIAVQPQLLLNRQGREAAPSAVVPVTVPAEAGAVEMQVSNPWLSAISVQFDGTALRVSTQQVPAGVYTSTVTLRSPSDPRYARSVDIRYAVAPPAAGEQVLSVANPHRYMSYRQGVTDVQRIVVTRPTWTDVWDAPLIHNNDSGIVTLSSTPDGHYEAAINTAGVPPGSYYPSIRFSAGPTGGPPAFVSFNIVVNDAFHVDGATGSMLTATSTSADIEWSNAVLTFDGVPARWTAVSQSPLLQVVNGSGVTGADPLRVRLDPSVISQPEWSHSLPLTLSIDRPGTLPQTIQYTVSNLIPMLHTASPSTLVGSSGRVYIEGNFRNFYGDPLASNRLRVEGATLAGGRLVADTRYIGDVLVLQLDLTGAVPGQPVRVHVDSALQPSQVELRVQEPLRTAAAFQALPYGVHRPGQYAPGLGAFYFSRPGLAYRWQIGSGSLTQAHVTGLIDMAPSPDERHVYALTSSQLLALHPQTFAPQSTRGVVDWQGASLTFSPAADRMRGLSISADGRALASLLVSPSQPPYNVGTVCVMPSSRAPRTLMDSPRSCDPGSALGGAHGATPSGTLRSANGSVVVGVNPEGRRSSYRADQRHWTSHAPLPSGVTIVAVSDSGTRLVRSDGMLITEDGSVLGSLAGVVPFTHRVGGYGLSSGGRFGLVYGYQTTGAGAAERASAASLWIIDLNSVGWTGAGGPPVVATLSLPSAVGCTVAFVEGETCEHTASVSVAPGDGTAFVMGPRGVAALGLPASVTSAQPQSSRVGARSLGSGTGAQAVSSTGSRGRVRLPMP